MTIVLLIDPDAGRRAELRAQLAVHGIELLEAEDALTAASLLVRALPPVGELTRTELLEAVLEAVGVGILVNAPDGELVYVNRTAAALSTPTFLSWNPLADPPLPGLYSADQKTALSGAAIPVVRALQGQPVEREKVCLLDPNSERSLYLEVSSHPLERNHEARRERFGAVSVVHDVTEQHRLEREVLESRAAWRALVESIPAYVMQVNLEGRVTFVNRAIEPLLGLDLVGLPFTDFTAPEGRARAQEAFAQVVATGDSVTLESLGLGPNGRTVWYSVHLGPIVQDDTVRAVIVVCHDISERKQTDSQLILTDRLASVGTLAAGVAHEINNPLATVLANLEYVKREIASGSDLERSSDVAEALTEAHEAAERVRNIVRDLRIFARTSEQARVGPVDLHRIVDSTLRLAQNEIRHRAQLRREFGVIPFVRGDEARLGQLILNLLINAAQAIPEGDADEHEIRLTTRVEADGRIALDIRDTGSGMSPEVQRRLFTPFFTTRPVGGGVGMGLSIAQRLAHSLGGEIRVVSREGEGSTFTVILRPVEGAERKTQPSVSVSVPAPRGRILVIDDEPMILRAIERILSPDHDVVSAARGEEALEQLHAGGRFDLILCDLMMPQISGMDLYAQLRTLDPALLERIIFLTGGAFTHRAEQFLDEVANERLEKPLDLTALRRAVNRRVRGPAAGPT